MKTKKKTWELNSASVVDWDNEFRSEEAKDADWRTLQEFVAASGNQEVQGALTRISVDYYVIRASHTKVVAGNKEELRARRKEQREHIRSFKTGRRTIQRIMSKHGVWYRGKEE